MSTLHEYLAIHNAQVEARRAQKRSDLGHIAGVLIVEDVVEVVFRGEQPDSSALPDAGALRGDVPLSKAERSEA